MITLTITIEGDEGCSYVALNSKGDESTKREREIAALLVKGNEFLLNLYESMTGAKNATKAQYKAYKDQTSFPS